MVGSGTATATVTDTVTDVTVDLTASTVDEGSGADYVFTATLSSASHGVTTIHTDQGDISIADGATTGTLTIASGNGEDVYTDASSLTASITGVSGGGFESLVVGSGTATATVTDTVTAVTVDLTASTVDEGAGADYVFTATLSSASHGVDHHPHRPGRYQHRRRCHHRHAHHCLRQRRGRLHRRLQPDGQHHRRLRRRLRAAWWSAAARRPPPSPTPSPTVTVDLTASTVDEGSGADYVFTATLSSASHGVTTIHTDQGDISIADGATTGTLDHRLRQRRGRLHATPPA